MSISPTRPSARILKCTSPYTWPKGLDQVLTHNCADTEQRIFRQALTDIFLHRNAALRTAYSTTAIFLNGHSSDQLLSMIFVDKLPTIVAYATTLSDMVTRFRTDFPASTIVLDHSFLPPPLPVHTYPTMDVDEQHPPHETYASIQAAGSSSYSSSLTSTATSADLTFSTPLLFDYPTPTISAPIQPSKELEDRFKIIKNQI